MEETKISKDQKALVLNALIEFQDLIGKDNTIIESEFREWFFSRQDGSNDSVKYAKDAQ